MQLRIGQRGAEVKSMSRLGAQVPRKVICKTLLQVLDLVLWFSNVHGSGELAALFQGFYTNFIPFYFVPAYCILFFPEVTGYWSGLLPGVLRSSKRSSRLFFPTDVSNIWTDNSQIKCSMARSQSCVLSMQPYITQLRTCLFIQ